MLQRTFFKAQIPLDESKWFSLYIVDRSITFPDWNLAGRDNATQEHKNIQGKSLSHTFTVHSPFTPLCRLSQRHHEKDFPTPAGKSVKCHEWYFGKIHCQTKDLEQKVWQTERYEYIFLHHSCFLRG